MFSKCTVLLLVCAILAVDAGRSLTQYSSSSSMSANAQYVKTTKVGAKTIYNSACNADCLTWMI